MERTKVLIRSIVHPFSGQRYISSQSLQAYLTAFKVDIWESIKDPGVRQSALDVLENIKFGIESLDKKSPENEKEL